MWPDRRRAAVTAVAVFAALFLLDTVEYGGGPSGVVPLVVFAGGMAVGYRAGGLAIGVLYGALAGVILAVAGAAVAAVGLVALVLVTAPGHGGWGFVGLGIGGAMLLSPLGLTAAGVLLGGAALVGGFGGLAGGAVARGRDRYASG